MIDDMVTVTTQTEYDGPVLSVAAMRASDSYTIKSGTPSKELMRRAAEGIYEAYDGWDGKKILIVCGSGNNAGDGYALAEILKDRGLDPDVLCLYERFSEDGAYYHERCIKKGVRMFDVPSAPDMGGYGVIVDCMLGTGFSGTPREPIQSAILAINEASMQGAFVISADINSGLNGDTGEAELAVKSDLTVSIGFLKTGFFRNGAPTLIGRLVNADIGIGLPMKIREFGDPEASLVLLQPVDEDRLESVGEEVRLIREMCGRPFKLTAFGIRDWNRELSPWKAPAVFGKEDFGDGAKDTLEMILSFCTGPKKTYCIGGYSLAGLFSLWASIQSDLFSGVAAASPSVWFPGFTEYLKMHPAHARCVYLSLGDREEKTRNPVMAEVGRKIRETKAILDEEHTECIFEWNEGNHFKDPELRTAKAFAHVAKSMRENA